MGAVTFGLLLIVPSVRAWAFEHWILSGIFLALLTVFEYGEYKNGLVSVLNHEDAKDIKPAEQIAEYEKLFGNDSRTGGQEHTKNLGQRLSRYTEMVNNFYDLVTDFYEYGWGESFHFGPRLAGETHIESLRRHEYYIASRLGLKKGVRVADFGCGIGGPMRNIARFSGATIVGVNNNDYQIKVGTKYITRDKLDETCSFSKQDFMKLSFADNEFDGIYEIEATCHAPDKRACYAEFMRVTKPGGLFAGYEWVMTDKYDAKDANHQKIKKGIEVGNGLPDIATIPEVKKALVDAGWELLDCFEMSRGVPPVNHQIGWQNSLEGSFTLQGFRMTWVGRNVTHFFVTILETVGLAPKGAVKVSKLLNDTALDLVESGRLDIFTPSYFFLARKPQNK